MPRHLSAASLKGKRLGVVVPVDDTGTGRVFAAALAALAGAGAEIVPIPDFTQAADTARTKPWCSSSNSSTTSMPILPPCHQASLARWLT